jgi:ubiquinone/menaquinone biosynthesis C-methylase UbiE
MASDGFADHFSSVAPDYRTYRPRYPAALFASLAAVAPHRRMAWDCATGSGQAAVALADHFDAIVATDASEQQLAAAEPHPRVRYSRAPAEASGLPSGSAALITVAQAIHWFDVPAFFAEVRRVLAPGGLFAVWCYNLTEIDPAVDALILHYYRDTVGPYWPPERAHIESGYRDIEFPFKEIALPSAHMEAFWSLHDLCGYLGTWSATQRYRSATGSDPLPALKESLAPIWGDDPARRRVRWPLAVRAGRVRR